MFLAFLFTLRDLMLISSSQGLIQTSLALKYTWYEDLNVKCWMQSCQNIWIKRKFSSYNLI